MTVNMQVRRKRLDFAFNPFPLPRLMQKTIRLFFIYGVGVMWSVSLPAADNSREVLTDLKFAGGFVLTGPTH